jgi:hypothetical protein
MIILSLQLLFVTEIHATVTVHVLQLEIPISVVVVMLDILDLPATVSVVLK